VDVLWDKTIGGDNYDALAFISPTSDGGYLLAGASESNISGDKSEDSRGSRDYWVVKIDANRQKQWDKTFGGNRFESFQNAVTTADGGYLLVGWSASGASGDKTENSRGGNDYWIVKIDANGNKLWDKTYGGSGTDQLSFATPTTDGGYLLTGWSNSDASGDKSEDSKGGEDWWIIKIDANGNKLWDKTLGGSGEDDDISPAAPTSDGGYIIVGDSQSNTSGDKSENSRGGRDYWVVKIDANGNKVWDKTFGGGGWDAGRRILALSGKEEYLLGGFSSSNVSGDKSENSRGGWDYWIVKIDADGNKLWDRTYGGSNDELGTILFPSANGGYLLVGRSLSDASGEKSEDSKGGSDFWIVKIDSQGNKIWDKGLGGNREEVLGSAISPTDGEYLLGGWSNSNISGDKSKNSQGGYDFWLIKVKEQPSITFRLIDADTDRPVLNLYDGYFASFYELPTYMAIEAIPRDPVGSIRIEVTGPGIQSARNQSDAPYSSFGDDNGDFKGMPAGVGVYHVKATPYSGRNATGVPGEPVEISFEFLEPPIAPVARLTAIPSLGSVPLTVFFDASGSTDEDGEIVEYFFDFGDGTSSRGPAATVSHTYPAAGEYEVLLNVRDDAGNSAAASTLITVVEEPTPGTAFRLIDAQTDAVITNLSPGTLLSAPGLPESLAIEVVPDGPVGSFKIQVVGPDFFSTKNESAAPYASFGDDNGDFRGRALGVGTYTVTATPYSGRNATGVPGIPVELNFEIAESAPDLRIAGFKFIDAQQNTELFDGRTFTNRLTVNTTEIPEENLGIEVIPVGPVGSIQVAVEGPGISTTMTENATPYSAFGDDGNDIFGREFREGTYLITATAYSGRNATGTAGTPVELDLEIESCVPPAAGFTAVPTSGKVPLGVRFTADEDNPDYNYLFDFGDGTDGFVGFSTTHTYTEVGEYTVTLTVTNVSTGCSSFSSQTIMVEEVLTPENVSFRLIDAKTDQSIMDLTDGTQINQASLPSSQLAIEVIPAEPVGSFKIQVNGPGLATSKNESAAPYASFGDDNGDFDGKSFQLGTYTVVATPYSGRNATGIAGSPAQIQFQITGDNAWVAQSASDKKSPEDAFVEFGLSDREEGSLLVYPNPAQSYVEVNLPLLNDQPYTLQLYDLYGREVFRQQGAGSVTESIPLNGQPRGTYLVAVQTGGQRLVQKLLITD
jgi:PKD repeat protein